MTELTPDDFRQAIWFGAAEAQAQGYDLPAEAPHFWRQATGSVRQWLRAMKAPACVQVWTRDTGADSSVVSIVAVTRDEVRVIASETVPLPITPKQIEGTEHG